MSIDIKHLHYSAGMHVRVGEFRPASGLPIGDILYAHGFADRLDNHLPLYAAWVAKGFRVIAYDLPSHGDNHGVLDNLSLFGFRRMAKLLRFVESSTSEDASRPLLLAGWSTGGLVVLRSVVNLTIRELRRKPRALILFAPGVSVRVVWKANEETLTRNPNPPHAGPLKPRFPMFPHFLFAARLMMNSWLSQWQDVPAGLPIYLILADDENDRYVKNAVVRDWALKQRRAGAKISIAQCRDSYHELDNELDTVATQVRASAAAYADAIVRNSEFKASFVAPCAEL